MLHFHRHRCTARWPSPLSSCGLWYGCQALGGGARVGGRGGGGGGVVQQEPVHCVQTPRIQYLFKLLTWRPALLALTPSVQNPTFHLQFQALVALD